MGRQQGGPTCMVNWWVLYRSLLSLTCDSARLPALAMEVGVRFQDLICWLRELQWKPTGEGQVTFVELALDFEAHCGRALPATRLQSWRLRLCPCTSAPGYSEWRCLYCRSMWSRAPCNVAK